MQNACHKIIFSYDHITSGFQCPSVYRQTTDCTEGGGLTREHCIWKRKNTFVNKFYTLWPTIYFWPLTKWSTMTGQIHNGTAISKFRLRDHNRKLYNLYTDRCRHVRFILLVLMDQYLSLCLRYCPEINMAEGFLQIHQVPSLWWVFLLHRSL